MTRKPQLSLFLLCLLVIFGVAIPARSGEVAAEEELLPLSSEFTVSRLENGLTYYVRANSEPEERARLMLVVKAGMVHEEDGERGAAHFVEHMAFNGTANFPGKQIDRFMESVGMGTCECYSGTTTLDDTIYTFWLPTDNVENLDAGFSILNDIAGGIAFDPQEVEKERGVLVEEWREGKGRDRENGNRVRRLLSAGSRYAERLTSNERSFAEDLDRETLLKFYRRWYRPERMAVIAVGDFDEKKVRELIHKRLAKLKGFGDAPVADTFKVPARKESELVLVTDPETQTFSLSLLHLHEFRHDRTIADYRRTLARRVFLSLLNNRLDMRFYEKDVPYLGVAASYGRLLGSRYSVGFSVSAEEGGLVSALDAVVYEAGRVFQDGFSAAEMERARVGMLESAENMEEAGFKRQSSSVASELSRNFLEGEPVPGAPYEVKLIKEFVPLVTLEEVNSFIEEYTVPGGWAIIVTAPEGREAEVPARDVILSKIGTLGTVKVDEYVDAANEGDLLPELPAPGKVLSVEKLERFGAEEWKLSNGATVILKPTEFEKTEILFSAFSFGGHSLASDDRYLAGSTAVAFVTGGGLGSFDPLSLGKKLTGKSAFVVPYISETEEGLSGGATPEDVETMLQILYLYFTAPRKDSVVFENLKKRMVLMLEEAERQPEKKLQNVLEDVMYNNHPRRITPSAVMLEDLDLNAAVSFYRERFADASDFTFFFSGSFTPESFRPLIERYIGGLPATNRDETWRDVGVELPRGVIKREVRTGTAEKAGVRLIFTGGFEWNQLNRLEFSIMNVALQNMLTEAVREDLSGTYDINVSGSLQRYPKNTYAVIISFNCKPENVAKLTAAVFACIGDLKGERELGSFIDPIKKKLLTSFENMARKNSYWHQLLAYLYRNGIEPGEYVFIDELMGKVTAEGVSVSARNHLDTENYVHVVYYSGD